jgi:hypothetical protein
MDVGIQNLGFLSSGLERVYSASWVQLWNYLKEKVALCWPRNTLDPQKLP